MEKTSIPNKWSYDMLYANRSQLVFIRESMNTQRYVDEAVVSHIFPYFRHLEHPLFQQNNALSHITRIYPNISPWPLILSWGIIGRNLRNLTNPPQRLEIFCHKLQVTWNDIPQKNSKYGWLQYLRLCKACYSCALVFANTWYQHATAVHVTTASVFYHFPRHFQRLSNYYLAKLFKHSVYFYFLDVS